MFRSFFHAALLCLPLTLGAATAYAQAAKPQTGASQTYARRDECVEAGRLSDAQCENAYRNARAEFEEKTPRYAGRASCERVHKRCGVQVSGAGFEALARGGATYVPRFGGIRVNGSGASATATPVVEGGGKLSFAARQVAALDNRVANRRAVTQEPRAASRRNEGGRQFTGQGTSGPFARRGDRDDTVRVPMERKELGQSAAPGLYVDRDGVEWYRPSRRR
ncbi:MAG: DUF1190 domain-containing protein [Bosea sp. (in: a-proteobacteria)]